MKGIFLTLICILMVGCASSPTATPAKKNSELADLVLTGGMIYTGNAQQPWAEAVAIRGPLIEAVGSGTDIDRYIGEGTRVVNLKGKLVIPGINDAHLHVPWTGEPGVRLDIAQDASPDAILELIRTEAARQPPGTLITGQLPVLMIDTAPSRAALDDAAPNHRVRLAPLGGHSALLNSAALDAWGISDGAIDPPGGSYGRTEGRLNGWLYEHAYWLPQKAFADAVGDEMLLGMIREFEDEALSLGITSAQTMPLTDAGRIETLISAGKPRLRWRVIDFRMAPFDGSPSSRAVKYIIDGTPIERSAAMRQPYADAPDISGMMNYSADEIDRMVENAAEGASQLLVHVAGDRSAETVLRAMARRTEVDWPSRRVRLEHGDAVTGDLVDLARELGVVIVQNPSHFMGPWSLPRYGAERASTYSKARSFQEGGVHFAIGSDGPINPYLNMMFATMHPNPSEALSVENSVRAYTQGSAYAEFEEMRKGTIAPGMLADLVVLSQNIFQVPPAELPRTGSMMTIVDGQVVWEQPAP